MSEIPFPEWGSLEQRRASMEEITWRHHQGPVIDRVPDYGVIQCQTCILNHVIPLPDEATVQWYYREVFYQRSKPDYVARYEEDRAWWTLWHTQTLEAAEAALGHAATVLDIGAGPAIFLDVAQARGWETYGIEPNEALAQAAQARGHRVACRMLSEVPPHRADDRVQLLHLYEVLEHIPDPQEFLLQAAELLVPGGLVHIVVPNDYNALQLAACATLGLPHWWVQPPEHLTYFTPKTLQLLVRRCGFDVLDLRSTYPMETFLFIGRCYVGDDVVGRQCHRDRMNLELGLARAGLTETLLSWYRANMAYPYSGSIGREIVCLARQRA